MTAVTLGRFGDRRLEKGGSFCTLAWLRWVDAGSGSGGLAGIELGRSG
jgi:hypothetical protein